MEEVLLCLHTGQSYDLEPRRDIVTAAKRHTMFMSALEAVVDHPEEVQCHAEEEKKKKDGVPVKKLFEIFYQLGQYIKEEKAMILLEKSGGDRNAEVVDKAIFLKMLDNDRMKRLLDWREKCGFSESQLGAIRHAFFENSDPYKGMQRDSSVLQALRLLNLLPPPEMRGTLVRAIMRVDRQGKGTIAFEDFLLLVRHLENQRIITRSQTEKARAEVAGIDSEAIQQFRQVFNDCDPNSHGKVTIKNVMTVFDDLGLVKDMRQRMALREVIDEVRKENAGLEFSQFLEVLHKLESRGIC
jgi:hypothetical protein